MYDRFVYFWLIHVNIELSLVVGWSEVELLIDSRTLVVGAVWGGR